MTFNKYRWLWGTAMLAVAIMSLMPYFGTSLAGNDNLFNRGYLWHTAVYAILIVISDKAFPGKTVLWSGVLIVYGVMLEVVQCFLPYRSFNWYDLFANIGGVLIGAFILVLYSAFTERSHGAGS